MANEPTRTATEEQRSAERGPRGSETRGSETRGLARRRGSDPFGFSLMPGSLFPTPFSLLDPWSLVRRMTDEMLYDRPSSGRATRGDITWAPAIEVTEENGNCVVRAELPGLKPEEVKVEVTDDALIIEGERKFENEENRSGVRRSERMYGRFYRIIPLPEGANAAEAKARFQDGMLEVTVPVTERQSNRREIPIQTSSEGASDRPSQQTSDTQR